MGHSALTCFKRKCTPVHEILTCVVAFMEGYTCCHFKVWAVHVMSTSIDRGQNQVNAHFPPNFSYHSAGLLKRGIRRLVGLLSISIGDEQHHVGFQWLGFAFKLYVLVSRFGLQCIYFHAFWITQLQHKFSYSGPYRVKAS